MPSTIVGHEIKKIATTSAHARWLAVSNLIT
jgi:hypothetical protein